MLNNIGCTEKYREEVIVAAHNYLHMGLSIVPVHPSTKIPKISWKKLQSIKIEEKNIESLFADGENIAIVTGKISNVIVIDADSEDSWKFLLERGFQPGPYVKTSRGYHAYCKYGPWKTSNLLLEGKIKIEIKSDGACVVAPPSFHPSGVKYKWIVDFGKAQLPDVPEFLKSFCENSFRLGEVNREKSSYFACSANYSQLWNGVPEGLRHNTLVRIIGHYIRSLWSEEDCLRAVLAWNEKNKPPLQYKEVEQAVRSLYMKQRKKVIEIRKTPIKINDPLISFEEFLRRSKNVENC